MRTPADLRRQAVEVIASTRGEPDFSTRFGERPRAGAPDTASGPGDKGHTAIQTEIGDGPHLKNN